MNHKKKQVNAHTYVIYYKGKEKEKGCDLSIRRILGGGELLSLSSLLAGRDWTPRSNGTARHARTDLDGMTDTSIN